MSDEVKSLQAARSRVSETQASSSRSSMDSSMPKSKIGSPAPTNRITSGSANDATNGRTTPSMDYVYLKNVLLQFLEQKDKKNQMQLIPVLGMLLHFDKYVFLINLLPVHG
jgi:GRIP domain